MSAIDSVTLPETVDSLTPSETVNSPRLPDVGADVLRPRRYLDLIAREAARFATVARTTPGTARCRTYPGFDAATLTVHVGATLVRSEHLVRTGALLPAGAAIAPPPHRAPADWLQDAATRLVSSARRADADASVPTFPFGDLRPLWWVYRSTVTEVAVHRWDLESVGSSHAPIAADLAVDLIDSVFRWWAPALLADRRIGLYLGGTVALHATDVGARWIVSVRDGMLYGRRDDAAGPVDAELAGPAQSLLLAVWKRAPLYTPGLVLGGDTDLVHRLVRIPYVPDPQISAAH